MRAALAMVVAMLWAGCGLDPAGDAGPDDARPTSDAPALDAAPIADAAPSSGVTWEPVPTPVTAIALLDPAPLNAGRPVRVRVTTELAGCDDLAMISVGFTLENEQALIETRAWRPLGADCTEPSRLVDRPVALELYPGDWQVVASAPGSTAPALAVTVGPEPVGPCGGGGACTRDCDCPAGQRCLGGNGFAGPFTACARPCELDRDCGGDGACISAADGLESYCEPGQPECDGARPCPAGFTCTAGSCQPDYTLGQAIRVACSSDTDCSAGLRCVEPALPGGQRRCEVACRTAGPWCTGAHVCGYAAQDLAGLAEQDQVCIWLGE